MKSKINELIRRACDLIEGLSGIELKGAMPVRVEKLRSAIMDIRNDEMEAMEKAEFAGVEERLAKSIYEEWKGAEKYPWQDGGNSIKQDEARTTARKLLSQNVGIDQGPLSVVEAQRLAAHASGPQMTPAERKAAMQAENHAYGRHAAQAVGRSLREPAPADPYALQDWKLDPLRKPDNLTATQVSEQQRQESMAQHDAKLYGTGFIEVSFDGKKKRVGPETVFIRPNKPADAHINPVYVKSGTDEFRNLVERFCNYRDCTDSEDIYVKLVAEVNSRIDRGIAEYALAKLQSEQPRKMEGFCAVLHVDGQPRMFNATKEELRKALITYKYVKYDSQNLVVDATNEVVNFVDVCELFGVKID